MRTASGSRGVLAALLILVGLAAAGREARAQDPQPRPYSNLPVGLNFLLLGYTHNAGSVVTDASLPLSDARIRANTIFAGYLRSMDVLGCASNLQVAFPYTAASGSAQVEGEQRERSVSGFQDPIVRMTVNFYGAPALSLAEYRQYEQHLIAGASLQVSVPLGTYDADRLLNTGMHRWSIRPQLGASKASGPWFFDLAASATFYTDNRDFLGGSTRAQDPIYAVDGYIVRTFAPGLFVVVFGTYYAGGRTTIDGVKSRQLLSNSRAGVSLSLPLGPQSSLRIFASNRLTVRFGGSFSSLGVAWQYRWGGSRP